MKIIGCDLHARKQTIAMLDSDTGELEEKTLEHEGDTVREFYSALPGPILVGIEATGWRVDSPDGLRFAHRRAHRSAHRATSAEEPNRHAGQESHHRTDSEARRRSVRHPRPGSESAQQLESNCLPAPGGHVPCETAHVRFAARNRPAIRRQAPHHRAPLDSQDCQPAPDRQRIEQNDQQATRLVRLDLAVLRAARELSSCGRPFLRSIAAPQFSSCCPCPTYGLGRVTSSSRCYPVAVGTPVVPTPPAQIRTGSIAAYGSYLGYLALKRMSG